MLIELTDIEAEALVKLGYRLQQYQVATPGTPGTGLLTNSRYINNKNAKPTRRQLRANAIDSLCTELGAGFRQFVKQ